MDVTEAPAISRLEDSPALFIYVYIIPELFRKNVYTYTYIKLTINYSNFGIILI